MADIATTDVTYTELEKGHTPDCRRTSVQQLVFGDGALTYPAGGVPLLKASMGAPTHIESLSIQDSGSANGFVYKYDRTNEKIRIYQGDNDNVADAALIELAGGVATPAAATLILNVSGY